MRAWLCGLVSCSLLPWGASALAQQAPPPVAPAPAGTEPASSLSAGGLAPPPAVEAAPPPGAEPATPGATTPASTEADLARADREDSGRGLEFVWLNGEVGVIHLGLGTFHQDSLVDTTQIKTTPTGLVIGAGLGARLLFFTVGARFRYAPLPDFKLWTLGLEAGMHWPLGALEPYATLGGGYVSIGSLSGAGAGMKVSGFDARLGGGLDYYLTNMFSLGVNVGADLMLLQRTTGMCVDLPAGTPNSGEVYCGGGKSTAGALTATAVGGLHF